MNLWIVNHYAIPPSLGGLNRHYYFSKYLRGEKVNTRIFSSSKIHNSHVNFNTGDLYNEENIDGVDYTFIKTSGYKGNGLKRIFSFLQFSYNCLKTMRILIKGERPDIIYASSPELFSTAVALEFGLRNNIPTVVEIRDLWPESVVEYTRLTRKNPIIRILYRLERWIYEKADLIVFTFEGGPDYIRMKNWDKESGGNIDLEKCRYINNGVEVDKFDQYAKEFTIEDSDLQSDKFKVVYTGSIRKVNSIGLLVDAAKILTDDGIDDISIIVFGDGTEKEALIERCKNLNLNNIVFKDRVDKKYIPYILSRANMNIFVGQDDAMNKYGLSLNKLFDYMASGKPILSNIESGYDNIKKYECGIIVHSNSAKSIAEGILKIKTSSRASYDYMCNQSKKAAEDFDYNKLSGKLYNILNELKGVH